MNNSTELFQVFRVVVCALASLGLATAQAENWPRFRGPTGQGISTEKKLPISWNTTNNIVWRTEVAGEGWSSPIVWRDKVIVTAARVAGTKFHVVCLAKKTGKVLWDKEVFEQIPTRKEGKNSWATPTPATDGKLIYVVAGDGSVAALKFDGSVAWTNREVNHYSRHGLGASPTLYKNLLIMPYDGSTRVTAAGQWPKNSDEERTGWQIPWDKAFVVALDTRTGKRIWTARRGKSRIAHITPNILSEGGKDQLISCAGDVIQGFDLKTGELVWTCYSQGEGVTPNFAIGDGLIYTSSGFEKTTIRTVRTGGTGDITGTHIAWEQKKGAPTQPGLLYVKPYLYSITDGGIAQAYHAKTGDVLYSERVGGNFCASPVYANGNIYFLSESGEAVVIAAGPKFQILSRNQLNERCQASMAVSQGNLFIRTDKAVYAVGLK